MARYVWPLKPDWSVWARRSEGLVHQAVALSCDFDPSAFSPGGAVPALAQARYLRRLDIVETMIQDGKLAFTVRPFGRTHADYVRFDDFAKMAFRLNWILPSHFPGRPDRPSPRAVHQPPGRPANAVSVVANTMRLVLSLTRKNPAIFERTVGLDQQALAVEIDAALGWEPREDGTPSDEALALAAAIRAAESANADRPLGKGRKPARGRPERRARRSAHA